MSEREQTRRETEWTDRIPDPETEEVPADAWEKTYPDGSAVHECWADGEEK